VVIGAFALAAATLLAQEYVNQDFQFAISFPKGDGWEAPQITTSASGALPKPLQLLVVASHSSGKSLLVQVADVDAPIGDARFREGFKAGSLKQFAEPPTIVRENVSTFAGVPSYELEVTAVVQNQPISLRMVTVGANGRQYILSGVSRGGDATNDPDLTKAFSTFRFTQPPTLPRAALTPRRLGELVGYATGCLVFPVIIVILAVVGWRALARRRTRSNVDRSARLD
jgi:hypothetical protein